MNSVNSNSCERGKPKIAIVYHWFANYRLPVIKALAAELGDEAELVFISAKDSLEPAMKIISPSAWKELASLNDVRWKKIENFAAGPFIWQRGVLSEVLFGSYTAVIFLGEFRILSTWPASILLRCLGKKVYFWSHGLYGNEGRLKMFIRLSFYRMANALLLYGYYSRKLLYEKGFSLQRMHVVFNSLDHESQKLVYESLQLSAKTQTAQHRPQIVFIGRLTKRKKVSLLLEAVSMLKLEGTDLDLKIVGEGPERESLQRKVSRLGIELQVDFIGACHDETVLAKLISTSQLCVSPGDIGLLAMHCMVYGTPVVTHDYFPGHGPEFETVIEGVTGGMFAEDDARSLANQIRFWVTLDDQQRTVVRDNCKMIIDRFFTPRNQAQVIRNAVLQDLPSDDPSTNFESALANAGITLLNNSFSN